VSHMESRNIVLTGIVRIYIYAQDKSHNDSTLSYMGDNLHCFHPCKDVFLLRQASKLAKAKGNVLVTEFLQNGKVAEERKTETWTLSKKRSEMNVWRDNVSHKIGVSKE